MAYLAVESMLDSAEINEEQKTVSFYEKKLVAEYVSSYKELIEFLALLAENECANNAPRADGGFGWDGSGIAESVVINHPTQLQHFFNE